MSNFRITIDCPVCKEAQAGDALDNLFGRHKYGYRCDGCKTIWSREDVDLLYRPKPGAGHWKHVTAKELSDE